MRTNLKIYFILFTCLSILNCKQKNDTVAANTIEVYDIADEADRFIYDKLNLDDSHPNLLNPQLSDDGYDMILEAWTNLHQAIGDHLDKNDFDWQIEAESISILHKFYFEENGRIKNYAFRFTNNKVSDQVRSEYGKLIQEFANDFIMDLDRDAQYAQCGKTKYMIN